MNPNHNIFSVHVNVSGFTNHHNHTQRSHDRDIYFDDSAYWSRAADTSPFIRARSWLNVENLKKQLDSYRTVLGLQTDC